MNRLANETSPYLRQHANNPVDWYPWGEEALERARREDKPILLSVGYSACHWCHVMEHESFENAETAALMNEHFISVKVDREERPDLDQIYQGVVQLMRGGGGWPLTVFLTPKLKPFFGGTYFPPTDRYGMPGFPKLLGALASAWKNQRADVDAQGEQFEAGLQHIATYGLDSDPSELTPRDVTAAASRLEREIDRVHGGFGTAPKFPNPMDVALLLRGWRRSKTPELLSAATLTLEKMALGGVYDQLGGGFHRYAVDERWLVPHFEKMLYDNAQLLHLYSEAQQVEPRPLWKKIVEETVEYVRREMTSPDGGFYSSQDADSEGEEGKFFVWTPAELDAVLPPKLSELAKRYFNVTPRGNFEHGATVLEVRTLEQSAEHDEMRQLLFEAREKRVKPGRDDKLLAGWNGLMMRGLAFASRVFGKPEWARMAAAAADFALARRWAGGKLMRTGKIDGFIEDYGDLALGLTDVYQATFERKYLDAAIAIEAKAMELFWDAERQAYLAAPRGQKDLLTHPYALHDNAFPSGASTLAHAQVTIAALTGKTEPLERAAKYLKKMRDPLARNPFGFGHLWLAADAYLDGAAEISLAGTRPEVEPFLKVLNGAYAPTFAADLRGPEGGRPAAYVCRNFACGMPITEPERLAAELT